MGPAHACGLPGATCQRWLKEMPRREPSGIGSPWGAHESFLGPCPRIQGSSKTKASLFKEGGRAGVLGAGPQIFFHKVG